MTMTCVVLCCCVVVGVSTVDGGAAVSNPVWNKINVSSTRGWPPVWQICVAHHVEWLLFDVVGAPTVDAQVIEMYNEGEWGGNKRRSSQ